MEPNDFFDRAIGPFYDSAGVASRLRVSDDNVELLTRRHSLLACPTAEGVVVYPTFQFDDSGTVLPGLAIVLAALAEGTSDRWQMALWLRTPSEQLQGMRPHEALDRGQIDVVRHFAIQTAAQWR